MIGNEIGTPIGGFTGIHHEQSVTASGDGLLSLQNSAGKNIAISGDGVSSLARSVAFTVAISGTVTAVFSRAVSFFMQIEGTVTAAFTRGMGKALSLSGTGLMERVALNVGKIVPVSVTSVIATIAATLKIVSREILHDVVNCVLAGQQTIFGKGREWDIRPSNRKMRTTITRSSVRRLDKGTGSFRSRTDNKGYD